jgi:hypothetical protein
VFVKIIRYKFLTSGEGAEEILIDKEFRCPAARLAANEETAKREAYKGEYTVEDDGQPEPETEASTDEVLDAMLGVM